MRIDKLALILLPFLFAERLNALTSSASCYARRRHLSPASSLTRPRVLVRRQDDGDFLLLRGGHNVDHQRGRSLWPRRRPQWQAATTRRVAPALATSGDDESSSNSSRGMMSKRRRRRADFRTFCSKNFFLVGMFVAVGLARAFPALGKNGGMLRPELFIGKYGVTFIFLLSGLSLELSQLGKAASNIKLNALIQLTTFGAWPFLVGLPLKYFFTTFLPAAFSPALLDGMLILSCLPTTVNMCVILTSAAGGSTAAALWNAIISNMGGIFFTPALLFRFFGASIQLPFLDMILKLSTKVLLPVTIGQALRTTRLKQVYQTHSKTFKRLQEVVLLSILWNAFCTAISNGLGLSLRDGCALLALMPVGHVASLALLFGFFSLPLFNFSRQEVVAAMFCASQKTLAFGLPLVNTIFEGNANLAVYCAPLMVIHPLQLIVGSLLIPKLEKYTAEESSSSSESKDK